jgi:hypothetical protein
VRTPLANKCCSLGNCKVLVLARRSLFCTVSTEIALKLLMKEIECDNISCYLNLDYAKY